MADGRAFDVVHRDFVALSPSGRTVIVFVSEESYSILDLLSSQLASSFLNRERYLRIVERREPVLFRVFGRSLVSPIRKLCSEYLPDPLARQIRNGRFIL